MSRPHLIKGLVLPNALYSILISNRKLNCMTIKITGSSSNSRQLFRKHINTKWSERYRPPCGRCLFCSRLNETASLFLVIDEEANDDF